LAERTYNHSLYRYERTNLSLTEFESNYLRMDSKIAVERKIFDFVGKYCEEMTYYQ